jgi:hypothetical protein
MPEYLSCSKINSTKKSFNCTYINKTDNQLYLTITEPVFSPRGDIIGKKEIDTLLKPISHRGIIEKHFKRFNIDVVANKNIIQQIILSEQ